MSDLIHEQPSSERLSTLPMTSVCESTTLAPLGRSLMPIRETIMNTEVEDTLARGGQDSIVEKFVIENLYGYRTIGMSSDYAATILIAKNGSGKTTLLGALDAFLRGHFSRLLNLPFDRIVCKLRDMDSSITLERRHIAAYFESIRNNTEFHRVSRITETDPDQVVTFITEIFEDKKDNYRFLAENTVFDALYRSLCGFDFEATQQMCDRLLKITRSKVVEIDRVKHALRRALKNIELVYLPTYRRIELPISEGASSDKTKKRRSSKFKVPISGLHGGDIQFGLSDIAERLAEMNQQIVFDSDQGYRKISADIINELIDGSYEQQIIASEVLPDKADLELFFSRLKERTRARIFNEISLPNMDKIYSSDFDGTESNKFLTYFLGKLNSVILSTKEKETTVEAFIASCNKYLSSQDDSTQAPDEYHTNKLYMSFDDKILRLNRKDLSVHVESALSQRSIALDALSSGEKQMISLFAKLHLYPKEKIVLIDEPELSLSIEWQRHILVDVVNAPLSRQVIAITHSPFVFDNELEPFAKALELDINLQALPRYREVEEGYDEASDE